MPTAQIDRWVDRAIDATPVYDLHTHLYPASFSKMMLWGIDELLTYHYLAAETLRCIDMSYESYWALGKSAQADLVWKTLFVERAPVSEACRGVLTVLSQLGLEPRQKTLASFRQFFASQTAESYTDLVFKTANIKAVVMTNDPLDPVERDYWNSEVKVDPRFKTVLRIDPLLLGWPNVSLPLSSLGYQVKSDLSGGTIGEVRRFLDDWIERLEPLYVACSLTPAWRYPDESATTRIIRDAIMPACREHQLPFALMVGVTRQVNPLLKLAGDAVGRSDIESVHRLCAEFPHNKFLCTMLARENTHELAVAARKHRNLMPFGCWWFLNNPIFIDEMTRMRMELLGTSFIPQHSDCRVLDQLIYKWEHSRRIIARVVKDKFHDLAATGWKVTQAEVEQTVRGYLADNFESFLARRLEA